MSRSARATLCLVGLLAIGLITMWLFPRASAPGAVVVRDSDAIKAAARALGYSAAFDAELQKIGPISPKEFARRYAGKGNYLAQLSWDPTTASFWNAFNPRAPKTTSSGRGDFRLNAEELKVFQQNGFVVSERLGGPTFAELFYRIYHADLPVYLSADALLHAWHRSYDGMLEELEQTYLAGSLEEILSGMAAEIPEARRHYGQGVLGDSLTDADFFLAVARSLLAGQAVKTYLGQERRVARTLRACESLALQKFHLFGCQRDVDFSQFKVRGHYENSELLKRYFRAMMWCGSIDLRIAGTPEESSPRELGAAIVLHDLLQRSGKFESWHQFDRLLQTFVGRADSMTFTELWDLLARAAIQSPADVKEPETLINLQADILAGKFGRQEIRGHPYVSPPGPEPAQLPRSFNLLGQKFAPDSWVTTQVVYDAILWDGDRAGYEASLWDGIKVERRVPSGLDVVFAALGNDQVVPELVARMTNPAGRRFRDGLPYQHNLTAVRSVLDRQDKAVWEENLYNQWLACLRELSRPTTQERYPEVMRTRAWAQKTLNTQLASWAQLRHDTILYTKQSYTLAGPICSYPAGFVEACPHFWARFERMATRAADLIDQTPFPDRLRSTQQREVGFLRHFAKHLTILKGIADKELAQQGLSKEEAVFLKQVVDKPYEKGICGPDTYSGWYFGLFYKGPKDATTWDAIVADVHTDVPDDLNTGDPGCVLHEGVGNVDLLVVAIDSGKDHAIYVGPLLSHYEFDLPGVTRKADSEWQEDVKAGKLPPRPEWTRSYLVPREKRDD